MAQIISLAESSLAFLLGLAIALLFVYAVNRSCSDSTMKLRGKDVPFALEIAVVILCFALFCGTAVLSMQPVPWESYPQKSFAYYDHTTKIASIIFALLLFGFLHVKWLLRVIRNHNAH